jgi:hypothetical protein
MATDMKAIIVSRSQTLFGNAFNDAPRHVINEPNMNDEKYNAEHCGRHYQTKFGNEKKWILNGTWDAPYAC